MMQVGMMRDGGRRVDAITAHAQQDLARADDATLQRVAGPFSGLSMGEKFDAIVTFGVSRSVRKQVAEEMLRSKPA